MADIFISYASEDREQAHRLADALKRQKWSIWWDRTIPTGRRFSEVIDEAITNARCIVVLWSRKSVEKDWVIEEAEDGKKRNILVPVFIEEIQPPRGFRLIQAADLSMWDGTDTYSVFQKLVNDIAGILGPPPTVVAEKTRKAEEEARKAGLERQEEDARLKAVEARRKAAEQAGRERQQALEREAAEREAEEVAKRKAEGEKRLIEEETGRLKAEEQRKAAEKKAKQAERERQKDDEKHKAEDEPSSQSAEPDYPTPARSKPVQNKIIARGVAAIVGVFIVVSMYMFLVTPSVEDKPPTPDVPTYGTTAEPAEPDAVEKGAPTAGTLGYEKIIALQEPRPVPGEPVETSAAKPIPDNPPGELSSHQWRVLQQALNDIGFDAGPTDGVLGYKTRNAISSFQEGRGLPKTGELTESQRERLLAEAREAAEGRPIATTEPEPGTVFHDTLKNGSEGPEMVVIPEGCFNMGSPRGNGDNDEHPQHRVCVPHFAMGKYEVTFDEYDRFAQAVGRKNPDDESWGRGRRPAINVTWDDATAYAEWLSSKTGKGFRLPTEAEWEYMARAGTGTEYWWGNEIGENRANCSGCGSQWDSKQTALVGSFGPNPFGLHDTAGNVWEWTQDCWHSNYNNAPKDERAWIGEDGGNCGRRVIRGGSWDDVPRGIRSANRYRLSTDFRIYDLGFRLAQDL